METALFITIGTRDVAIKSSINTATSLKEKLHLGKQNEDIYWLGKPKKDGRTILDDYELYQPHLSFPIISPVIAEIIEMGETGKIDYLFLIYTDQSRSTNSVAAQFIERDSIHMAFLIEKEIKNRYRNKVKKIKKIPVSSDVVFHDSMYNFFDEKFKTDAIIKKLSKSADAQIYVLPQGGIASINTTLLLKCAEYFTDITQLSKPQGFLAPVNSHFPQLFKRNLTKERIKLALETFDYSVIVSYNYSPIINTLATYAFRRVTFNFFSARKILFQYKGMEAKQFISALMTTTKRLENEEFRRFQEWFLICKVSLHQKKYADFLLKIFNLAENILKPFAAEKLGCEIKYNANTRHKEWLQSLDKQPQDLKDFLKNYEVEKGNSLRLGSPSRYVYKAIFDFYATPTDKLAYEENIHFDLEKLALLRNQVGHKLIGVSKADINNCLQSNGKTIEDFVANLDAYFSITGFGDYEKINHQMLQFIN